MHVKSRRVDPFGAKCRDMERKILAAKRPGKVRARKEKRRVNSSERVRMNHLLTEARNLRGGLDCPDECSCAVCGGSLDFVESTTWRRLAAHESGLIRQTYTFSIKRIRRGDDHVNPILRWFVMHLRDTRA